MTTLDLIGSVLLAITNLIHNWIEHAQRKKNLLSAKRYIKISTSNTHKFTGYESNNPFHIQSNLNMALSEK